MNKNIFELINNYNNIISRLLNLLKDYIDKYNEMKIYIGYERYFKKEFLKFGRDTIKSYEIIFDFKKNLISIIIYIYDIDNEFINYFNNLNFNAVNISILKNFPNIFFGNPLINNLDSIIKTHSRINIEADRTIHLIHIQDLILNKIENYYINMKQTKKYDYIDYLFKLNELLKTNKTTLTKIKEQIDTFLTPTNIGKINKTKTEYLKDSSGKTNLNAIDVLYIANFTPILTPTFYLNTYLENIQLIIENLKILLLEEKELSDVKYLTDFLIKLNGLGKYIYIDEERDKIILKNVVIRQITKDQLDILKDNLNKLKNKYLLFDNDELKEEFKILLIE